VKLALRGLLVLVAAFAVAQTGAAAPARTRLVARPGTAIFWTPRAGLLGIGYCKRAGRCVRGAIERTTDRGRSYHVVLRAHAPITEIDRVGPHGAIVTAADGAAWRTLDGGRTWRTFTFRPRFWATPRVALRFHVFFQKGVQKLALSVTHDSGRTWRRLTDPCNRAVIYNVYADAVTPKLWWILCVGRPAGGTMEKAIFRTRDGGKSWQAGAAYLLGPPQHVAGRIGLNGYPNGLAFAPNGFGFVTESQGTLYVTRDGARHFRRLPTVARPNHDSAGGSAAFSNGVGYVLLAAGFSERLVATRDFGRTWRVVHRWRG
jgi:photosystem II stability/assembly factor-like uncharacterized protein